MKLLAVAIYDAKALGFTQPLFVQALGQAVRSFSDSVNDGKSEFARHPEDYTMFHVGSYDDATGLLEALPTPVSLALGSTLKVVPEQLRVEGC